jgi:hypothetical protein
LDSITFGLTTLASGSAAAVGAYVGSYLKERGKAQALKRDFDDVLSQLQRSVQATEEIRQAVSFADWTAREWNGIRRVKIESFVEMLSEFESYESKTRSDLFHQNLTTPNGNPMYAKLSMIVTLYLPELQLAYKTYSNLVIFGRVFYSVELHQYKDGLGLGSTQGKDLFQKTQAEIGEHYQALEALCVQLMWKLAGSPVSTTG